MIIFGTRSISTTRGRGHFHCPQCSARSAYRQRRARGFFHIYWIPLIPISGGKEYVRCDGCRSDFHLDILKHDPSKRQDEATNAFGQAVRHVVVAMIAADANIDPAEVARARQIVSNVLGHELDADEVYADATAALDGRIPIDASLRAAAEHVNEHGKEVLVRIAIDIAASDGELEDEEIDLIQRIAVNLGMSPAHLRGILLADPEPDAENFGAQIEDETTRFD
ncbi:MAG: hypothetical protein CMJ31_05530 [Phycisphaerae bacterium]|nr:hypothetical protein [Phycisphaerae bacterium]